MNNRDFFVDYIPKKGAEEVAGGALRALLDEKAMTIICDAFDRKVRELSSDFDDRISRIVAVCDKYSARKDLSHMDITEIHIQCDYLSDITDEIERCRMFQSRFIDFVQAAL